MSDSSRSTTLDVTLLILGILLGGAVSYGFNYYSLQQQQALEQHNVAQALYFDISHI